MTRDRVPYDAQWNGRRFTVVDTGGWEPDARDRAAAIAAQAEIAVADRRRGAVRGRRDRRRDRRGRGRGEDAAAQQASRCSWSPTRSTTTAVELESASLWSLGLGQPYPVSALHGRGSGDLLDAVLDALPDAPPRSSRPARAARAGSPWSAGPTSASPSLLNRLAREERAVVDSVAGTTVDPVDSLVADRRRDLAARRHRRACASGSARPAARSTTRRLRTAGAIEAAEVAVVLLDAAEPISEQDQRVLTMVVEAGRALVHRLQQVGPGRRRPALLPRQGDRPRAASASRGRSGSTSRRMTGRAVDKLAPALRQALAVWETARTHRSAQPVADRAGAGDAAPGARRAGAAGAVRDPGGHRAAAVRAVHDRAARRRATSGSSSASCARSSGSRAARSRCRSSRARSSAPAGGARRTARSLPSPVRCRAARR